MWFKVDDGFAFHAKRVKAGLEAVGAWTVAGSWSSANLTDGYIPPEMATTIAPARVWRRLIEAGLVDVPGDGRGGFQLHDFLTYNPGKAEVLERRSELSAKRAEAGRRGGKISGETRRGRQDGSKPEANGEAKTEATGEQNEAPIPIPIPIPIPKGSDPPHSPARAPEAPEASSTPSLLGELLRLSDEGHAWSIKIRDALPTHGGRLTHGQRRTLHTILAEQAEPAPPTNGRAVIYGPRLREGPRYMDARDIEGTPATAEELAASEATAKAMFAKARNRGSA